jgi:hypothetical protein
MLSGPPGNMLQFVWPGKGLLALYPEIFEITKSTLPKPGYIYAAGLK